MDGRPLIGSVVVARLTRPFVMCLCSTVIVAGCGSDADHSTALPVPEQIRQASAIDSANLLLEIRINNGTPSVFSGQGLDNAWVVPLTAPAFSTNTLTVEWYENFQDERLLLASQTTTFSTADATASVTLDGSYTTTGTGYDFDSDGVSNLAERNTDTNPLVADSGTFVVNEPETVALSGGCYLMGSADDEPGRGRCAPAVPTEWHEAMS